MNTVIQSYTQRLEDDAERITKGLRCLGRDCSAWARTREEKDLKDLLEDLERIEIDVSLILTDCIWAGSQFGEDSTRVIFHDFRDIFGRLDTIFNGLKKARLQLNKTYIHPATLAQLEVDCGRFRKLIREVRKDLNEKQDQSAIPLERTKVHLVQGSATTV